ncbi:hypothetical protein [Streptomyces sp. NRRL S-1824]|uniref:SPOR domain-containing protein n=1 Tax=Streptomyces sp. NRRL S-1824 TaxID=1463889 RepID=UPI002D21B399|nr:hypothetical protein [Streptomyces sp. NRRL S-1824]
MSGKGFAARVEDVTTPAVADFAGGSLGFRVRIGLDADKAAANALLARVGRGFHRLRRLHRVGRRLDRPRSVARSGTHRPFLASAHK